MQDDQRLLERVARGDRSAMHSLYMRHQAPLYAFVRQRCDDDALAQDVVQDAMLAIWQQAGRYGGRCSVRTWLFSIGRNKLVDRLRRSAPLSFTDDMPDVVDDAPGPEAMIDSAQLAQRIRDCIDRMKQAHLSVIRLAFLDGLTYEEIAVIEGIPLGTVKSRIHHAKKTMERMLGQPV